MLTVYVHLLIRALNSRRDIKFYMSCFSESPIEEVNLSSGRSLEIECGIKSADPNLEIKWTKNGVPWTPPPNNPKIYFTNNKRKIVFESVTEEDNGNYMCVANNLFKTSSTTDLFLESPGT